MTDDGRRYVGLGAELEVLDADSPRYDEVTDEMDRIWGQIGEMERLEIEGLLFALDEVKRTGKGYPPSEEPEPEQGDEDGPEE